MTTPSFNHTPDRGCPSTEERVTRRLQWLFPVLFFGVPMGLLGLGMEPVFAVGAAVLLVVATAWWIASINNRQLYYLRRCDFMVCDRCRYDLRALPDQGLCPECGRPYLASALRATWLRTYSKPD